MPTMFRLAAIAAVATASAASCVSDGVRAVGAEGFPAVPYVGGCCNGAAPVPRAGDWGLFCDGGAGGCYGPGERNEGAEGYPFVEYKPCCDGQASVGKPGDWGKFCPGGDAGGGADKSCYENGERQFGAEGFPFWPYKPCCDVNAKAAPKENDWGEFCTVPEVSGCYGQGERAVGQENFPAVPYKPCCDPAASLVTVDGEWGQFCQSPGTTVAATPAAPTSTGDRGVGENCPFSDSTVCQPGLFCKAVLCGRGGCKFECQPVLAEGEECASATAFGAQPNNVRGTLSGSGANPCADGLSCQWRGAGEAFEGGSFGRDYACYPELKDGECFPTLSADSDCFEGIECAADGSRVAFAHCVVRG